MISKACILLSLLAITVNSLEAKSPNNPAWVFAGGGAKNDKVRGVATDLEGNVYLTGETVEDGTFGSLKRKSHGSTDAFLLKISPKGEALWIRTIGGSEIDRGYGVDTDTEGNVYVTGHHQSKDAHAENTPLSNQGDYDVFLAKYSPKGDLLWLKSVGGKGYDYSHGVVVDDKGDVIIAGALGSDTQYEQTLLSGNKIIFCAKYHSDGKLVWVKGSEGKVGGSAHGVSVDKQGNIYLGGIISGQGSFGQVEVNQTKPAAMVTKLTSTGDVSWVVAEPASINACYHEITSDSQGRIWASGMFKGEIKLGENTYTSQGAKDYNGLFAHYNENGKLVWSKEIKSDATDYGLGVVTDDHGTSYFVGEFSLESSFDGLSLTSKGATDILVASFDTEGNRLSLDIIGGEKSDSAYPVTYHDGHIYFGGSIFGPIKFGDIEVKETQSSDLYVTKLKVK